MIDVYGTKSPRCSTIRAQSAYSPLLPPYSMFGYVPKYQLYKPTDWGRRITISKSFTWECPAGLAAIVTCGFPSSQTAVLLPYPIVYSIQTSKLIMSTHISRRRWAVKLSLSPSKEIYKILITTLVCLASLGIIILGFDIKERREDSEQEKGFRQKFIIN